MPTATVPYTSRASLAVTVLIPTCPVVSIINGVVSLALLSTLTIFPEPLVDLTLIDSPDVELTSNLALGTELPIPTEPDPVIENIEEVEAES